MVVSISIQTNTLEAAKDFVPILPDDPTSLVSATYDRFTSASKLSDKKTLPTKLCNSTNHTVQEPSVTTDHMKNVLGFYG